MGKIVPVRTSIYRRKTPGGKTSWMVRWRSPASLRWKTVTGGRTREEAEIVEARIRMLLAQGKDPAIVRPGTTEVLTVGDLIDRFYQHPRFRRGTKEWQRATRGQAENQLRPALGKTPWVELKPKHLYELYLQLVQEQHFSHSWLTKMRTLVALLGDLHVEITGEPGNVGRELRDFSRYFTDREPKRAINFLTPDEIERLLEACGKVHQKLLRPLCQLLAFSGLRKSEALNLKWTDLDLETWDLHVRHSKSGKARIIPLEPRAWQAIEPLQGRSEYVFAYFDGRRPDVRSFRSPLKQAKELAGITKRIDLHTFRHSFGSNKVRAGWGLKKVSMLLGHSDISITSRVYTHLLNGDLRVRDDARIDESPRVDVNEKVTHFAAAVLSAVARNAAETVGDQEQLAAFEAELQRATEVIRAKAAETGEMQPNATDRDHARTNDSEQPRSPSPGAIGQRATPVLQLPSMGSKKTNRTGEAGPQNRSSSRNLTAESFGRGGGKSANP